MMNVLSIRKGGIVITLVTSFMLGACSQPDDEAHAEAEAGAHAATSSSAGLPDGRIAVGEQLSVEKREATGQSCVDCHGPGGSAPIDPSYPKLAGQYADYIEHALQGYRSGVREQPLMASQAQDLTDQQIADLAAYFAAQEGELVDLANVD